MNDVSDIRFTAQADGRARAFSADVFAVVVITLLGAALRIYRLDIAELWTDEITGVIWSNWNMSDYLHMMYTIDWIHFPLPTRVLWALIAVFGDGQTVYRMLGFIPGTLAIPAVYLMARELLSREVGVVAAVLLAFSPTAIYVSQEAWDYGLTLVMVTPTVWVFFRAWRLNRWRDWLLFAPVALVCFYTHLLNGTILASLYLVYGASLLVPRRNRAAWLAAWKQALKPALMGAVVAGLCIAGALPVLRTGGPGANPQAGVANPGETTLFSERFLTVMRHFAYDRPVSLYLLAVLALLGIPFLFKRPRQWLFVLLAGLSLSGPLYLAVSAGYIFRVRHSSFALPFVLTAMACGIVTLRQALGFWVARWRGYEAPSIAPSLALAAVIMVVPAVQSLQQYYMIRAPQSTLLAYTLKNLVEERLIKPPTKIQLYSKSEVPEYREVAAVLCRNMAPGDILILDTPGKIWDDIGRNTAFQLNRRFGFDLRVDKDGLPRHKNYDPGKMDLMLSEPKEEFLQSILLQPLPDSGVQVFRVSQRYPIGEMPDTTSFQYSFISLARSNQRFTDKPALIAYLRAHAALSRASDMIAGLSGPAAQVEPVLRESIAVFETSNAAATLGAVLLSQGKVGEAEPLLARSARMQPDQWETWYRLGKARETLGRTKEAIAAYEATANMRNAPPEVLRDVANLYKANKDLVNAYIAYSTLARRTGDAGCVLEAARVAVQAGEPARALQDALPILEQQPDWGLANLVVGQAYQALKQPYQAYSYFMKAVAYRPDDADTLALCAQFLVDTGKYAEAEDLLKSALQRLPDNPTIQQWLKQLQDALAEQNRPPTVGPK